MTGRTPMRAADCLARLLLVLASSTSARGEQDGAARTGSAPAPRTELFDLGPPLVIASRDVAGLQGDPSAAPDGAAEEERWSSFLPLLKEEALARGYQLPLPFGVGATCTVLTGRDIEVTDLRIGIDGGTKVSVADHVDLGSNSDVFNANLKLDAWILPFLNVYALLGYVYNESETDVRVSVPIPGPTPGTYDFDMTVDTDLDGFVGGLGLTLAGGYGDFFMVFDTNWSQTDIGFDDSFRAITASLRAGIQTTFGATPMQIWTGVAYWDTENTAKGHTDVPGVGRIDFEADQGPEHPVLLDFGANVRLSRSFEFFADLAIDLHGGVIATVGPVFRF